MAFEKLSDDVYLDTETGAKVFTQPGQSPEAVAADAATDKVIPPSSKNVNDERDRRITLGFAFDRVMFDSRPEDQKRIAGAGTLAVAALMNGAQPGDLRWHEGDADFVWIAADNSVVSMDAPSMVAFGKAAARWERLHVFAARALKDTEGGIPADFTDNKYWPAGE